MHGRGINQVLTDMLTILNPDKLPELEQQIIDHINIDVFIESNRIFIIDKKFDPIVNERMNCYISYNQFQNVLRASDLFLESFYANLIPNTSFVNAWKFKDPQKGDETRRLLDPECHNDSLSCYATMEREEQKKYGFHSKIYYEPQEDWLTRFAEFYCIRLYYNDDGDTPLLVPYVFLKPMDGEQIDALLERFHAALALPQIWQGQSDAHYILKYEYLTKLISDCYGLVFMASHLNALGQGDASWDDLFTEDDIVSEFTFGRENILPMELLRQKLGTRPEETLRKILEDFSLDYVSAFEEENDSRMLLNSSMPKTNAHSGKTAFQEILNSFLRASNIQDEIQAEEKEERYFGLSTIRIKYILQQKDFISDANIHELYGELIRCMDTGAASLSIKKITCSGKTYYGAIINSGEQAYRFMQEELAPMIHYMAKIETDCLNLSMSSQRDTKIDEFLTNIHKENKNGDPLFDNIYEIKNIIKERNGRYGDLDVQRSGYEDRLANPLCKKAYEQLQY